MGDSARHSAVCGELLGCVSALSVALGRDRAGVQAVQTSLLALHPSAVNTGPAVVVVRTGGGLCFDGSFHALFSCHGAPPPPPPPGKHSAGLIGSLPLFAVKRSKPSTDHLRMRTKAPLLEKK